MKYQRERLRLFEYICIKMVGQQGSELCSAQTALARESMGGLRGERRTEGGKDVASGLEGWTPKIMTDRRHHGLTSIGLYHL